MKYKVSFYIEGEYLGDDTPLNKENLKQQLMMLDVSKGSSYFGNRSIDTSIVNLSIERVAAMQ